MELARYHISRSDISEPLAIKASIARDFLEQALAIRPGDRQVLANMATTSFMLGNLAQGRSELRQAIQGGGLDLKEENYPHLATIIKLLELDPAAL